MVREIFRQALDEVRAPWRLGSLRWERWRTWEFDSALWAVRARILLYVGGQRILAISGVDFFLPSSWPGERYEAFYGTDEYQHLSRALVRQKYRPFAKEGSQAANTMKSFAATAKNVRSVKTKLDNVLFGSRHRKESKPKPPRNPFEAAILEFSADPSWEPAGALWFLGTDVKLRKRGSAELRLQLLQEDSGPLNVSSPVAPKLFPASLVRVIPTGPDRLETIARVAPILDAAGYVGGPTNYYSGKTMRPLSPVGEWERKSLGPGGLAAEARRLEGLAVRLHEA